MRLSQTRIHFHVVVASLAIVPVMGNHLTGRGGTEGGGDNGTSVTLPLPAESYFREATASSLLHGHVALMSLSWIGAFPIYFMLDLAHSSLAYPARLLFLSLHTIGIILGLAYNSKTPDLYPGNLHDGLGWVLTGVAVFQFGLEVLRTLTRWRPSKIKSSASDERAPFIPDSENGGGFQESGCREDLEVTSSRPSLCRGGGDGTSSTDTDSETLYDVPLPCHHTSLNGQYDHPMPWAKRWTNVVSSKRLVAILDLVSTMVNAVLVILAVVAMCTGIATMAGIFHGKHLFNGLAHFIKGGTFFIYGLMTFSRWMGCFSHLGWAWNLKATTKSHNWRDSVTMEGVECFAIFLYGITNVFLEHLSAWGEPWAPQDFEHVAISLLFIGGGLCGMMVETKTFRVTLDSRRTDNSSQEVNESPLLPGYSINPIPAMIILILGVILGGHHQNSIESTMMHKWVGNFLTGSSLARCLTYLLIYISPPISTTPSRLPSELVTSFCLMSGGVMLMASNRDTVDAIIANGLNTMQVATVNVGVMAALMAWCMVLFVLRAWAGKREERYRMLMDRLAYSGGIPELCP